MGLNIREIVSRKELDLRELKDKTICVDAFNVLYQFLSTIRQADGTPLQDEKGEITSHLSGIFYRNLALIKEGIKLVYVFDGEPPVLKDRIHEKRGEARNVAREKYEAAREEENFEVMKRYSSQLIRLEDKMIEESKELLEAMGVCVVQAPGEGEAEAAYLSRKKGFYGVVSQDYDSLIFGAPILIRNLTVSRKKKMPSGYVEIKPEKIILDDVLNELKIDLDQLISLAILVGTDYNPKGVPMIGQKKALKIVQEFNSPEKIFDSVKDKIENLSEEDKFDWKVVFSLLRAPKTKDFELEFPSFNFEKIKEILVDRHGFSEERVSLQLDKLNKLKVTKDQKSLNKWF
ncbi:flap endonuclease-1 [Candidatus Pacearchaeota archaeon CG_4_9_14_3_um_filter_30_11]|nr:MAG: flap endonuclease-1 [Candidatus Pacearchaeota archaeon CG_4_9_14_3_um_filter_30_11]